MDPTASQVSKYVLWKKKTINQFKVLFMKGRIRILSDRSMKFSEKLKGQYNSSYIISFSILRSSVPSVILFLGKYIQQSHWQDTCWQFIHLSQWQQIKLLYSGIKLRSEKIAICSDCSNLQQCFELIMHNLWIW